MTTKDYLTLHWNTN